MPSRASTSFLHNTKCGLEFKVVVSMPSRASTSFLLNYYKIEMGMYDDVSMPSRASTSFLQIYRRVTKWYHYIVSMPSRASTSFLQYAEFLYDCEESERVNADHALTG